MDYIFDIENDEVVLNHNIYSIPVFKAIKDKYPEDYIQAFNFIHHMTSITSPYYNYKEDERRAILYKDFPGEYHPMHREVAEAESFLFDVRIRENTLINFWNSAKNMLDKMSNYLNSAIIDDSKEGNISNILRTLEKTDKLMSNFKKLEEQLEKEMAKARGDKDIGYDQ